LIGFLRRLPVLVLALGCWTSVPAYPATARPMISASAGTLVRWSAPDTMHCAMKGRSWAALHETCYYPIDLLQRPAVITITR
jgi:hypothetical protein